MMKFFTSRCMIVTFMALLFGCAHTPPPPAATEAQPQPMRESVSAQAPTLRSASTVAENLQLPVRYQQPNYLIKEPEEGNGLQKEDDFTIQVGADISSTTGPVSLRDILKRLAALKGMNISWASDVDQNALVDVDIRAEEDFFKALDNLLRQVDYFHEVQENTIVVKYKETRRFHIAMPFMVSNYTTGVGGNVLGSTEAANVVGNIQLTSEENVFNIWENIQTNLDQILDIWSEPAPQSAPAAANEEGTQAPAAAPPVVRNPRSGKGYYSIDKPIGLITVTAPRPLQDKIADYLENLKKELYRQVSIEAKILEVTLEDSSKKGIDWTDVISNVGIDFQLFGPNGIIYAPDTANRVVSAVSTPNNPFSLVLNAIEEQGRTKVLANPKLSVMNGQPALISVGENIKYIDKIESKANEGGVVTFTVTTASIMSGLGMSVVANIMEGDEIILSLTPVTSQLQEPIAEEQIGAGKVMLPKVRLRELNTIVRVKDGGMLVVGGLIDENDDTDTTKVPILGNIPGLKKFFSSETKVKNKTELIILLRPLIIS